MITIRLQRHGRTKVPFYWIVVAQSTCRRDGKFIEKLGQYNPLVEKSDRLMNLKLDRINHWKSVGAAMTDRVAWLLKNA